MASSADVFRPSAGRGAGEASGWEGGGVRPAVSCLRFLRDLFATSSLRPRATPRSLAAQVGAVKRNSGFVGEVEEERAEHQERCEGQCTATPYRRNRGTCTDEGDMMMRPSGSLETCPVCVRKSGAQDRCCAPGGNITSCNYERKRPARRGRGSAQRLASGRSRACPCGYRPFPSDLSRHRSILPA